MKNPLSKMAVFAALTCAVTARAEMVHVVEVTDTARQPTYQIVSDAEMKALKQTLDSEARVFPKALEVVKKEWDAAEKTTPPPLAAKPAAGAAAAAPVVKSGPRPFPAGSLAMRKMDDKGFMDRAQAEKKVQALEDSQVAALDKSATKAKSTTVKKTDSQKKAEAQRKARDAERDAAAKEAAIKLQSKIDDLVREAANPTPATAAAADNKDKPADPVTKPAADKANAADKAKPAAK